MSPVGAFVETFLREPGRTLLPADLLARKAYILLRTLRPLRLVKSSWALGLVTGISAIDKCKFYPGTFGAHGDHQCATAAVGNRPANPTCRSGDADHQQHSWPARQGAASLCSHRQLSLRPARKCGAVGSTGKVAPHPQRSTPTLPARTPTSATTAPQSGLSAYRWLSITRISPASIRPTAGFRMIRQPPKPPAAAATCLRHTSTVFAPASCSLTIAMICSSVNLLRFIRPVSLRAGSYFKMATFQGSTSGALPSRRPLSSEHRRLGGGGSPSVLASASRWRRPDD